MVGRQREVFNADVQHEVLSTEYEVLSISYRETSPETRRASVSYSPRNVPRRRTELTICPLLPL